MQPGRARAGSGRACLALAAAAAAGWGGRLGGCLLGPAPRRAAASEIQRGPGHAPAAPARASGRHLCGWSRAAGSARASVGCSYERGGAAEGSDAGAEQREDDSADDALAMWDSAGAEQHEGGLGGTAPAASHSSGGSEQAMLDMWDSVDSDTGAEPHAGDPHGSPALLSPWDSVGSAIGGQPYQSGNHGVSHGQHLVGFSKHRDMTYQEALNQEPGFCDWVMRTSQGADPGPAMLEFAQWLQEQGLPSVGGGTPANGFDLGPGGAPSGLGNEPPAVGASGDSEQRRVGFSKHRDMTYQEALNQEPGFCDWVMRTSQGADPSPAMLEFARWLQEQGVEPRT